MTNDYDRDFCPICLVDYDEMTPGQRDLHGKRGEIITRSCDPERACRDALDDVGASLDHTDDLNLEGVRDAALLYVAACLQGGRRVDPSLVEDLVAVLDDDSITSDSAAADAATAAALRGLVSPCSHATSL